jgi:hypothetical protein
MQNRQYTTIPKTQIITAGIVNFAIVANSSKINGVVPRAGFEHATTRSSAERSPRLSYLGTFPGTLTSKIANAVLKVSENKTLFV